MTLSKKCSLFIHPVHHEKSYYGSIRLIQRTSHSCKRKKNLQTRSWLLIERGGFCTKLSKGPFINYVDRILSRVWVPPPCPMGAPWGPHPHPPWGWGIEFEKPRGWGILTKTPWGFGGVFHAFLCFSCRKFLYFCSFFLKKCQIFFQ